MSEWAPCEWMAMLESMQKLSLKLELPTGLDGLSGTCWIMKLICETIKKMNTKSCGPFEFELVIQFARDVREQENKRTRSLEIAQPRR